MKKFEVFFATDQGYIKHLAVAIKSLFINNKGLYFLINVITGLDEDSDEWLEIKKIISDNQNSILIIHKIDESMLQGLKVNHHFKISNYYRLFIQNLAINDLVLYLDADIVINGKIDDIFEVDLNDSYLAAVENPGFKRHKELKMHQNSKYFNSGVMCINVKKWRKDDILLKVTNFVMAYPDAIEFVDQCGLNAVVDGKWVLLSPVFNQQFVFFEDNFRKVVTTYTVTDIDNSKNNPIIVHFTGSSKPWQLCNKHPFKGLYWFYRNKTGYASIFPDDFSMKNFIKCYTPSILKKLLKTIGIKK